MLVLSPLGDHIRSGAEDIFFLFLVPRSHDRRRTGLTPLRLRSFIPADRLIESMLSKQIHLTLARAYAHVSALRVRVTSESRDTPPFFTCNACCNMAELESVESLLEASSQRALSEHELSELKRIFYGKPAQ